jgi:hypothetical protein
MIIEALSNGIPAAIVVVIYLLIVKWLDSKKESKQVKVTEQLYVTMSNIDKFILSITKNIIDSDKEKCKAAIKDSLYASAIHLIDFTTRSIINNNVEDNRDTIQNGIENLCKSNYYKVYATLSLYTINDYTVSHSMKDSWIKEIEDTLIKTVFDKKLPKETKILAIYTRTISLFETYVTYIINNGIKH